MSKAGAYRVPFTVCEWRRVQSLYLSKGVDELKEALTILALWKSRMGNSTPVAITCSDLLLRVAVAEAAHEKNPGEDWWVQQETIKLQHCISIIRFINYVNEICQKTNYLMSIAQAVRQMGIPQWVVNIRHDASHDHVPPLATLRAATDFSRQWLWDNFWARPIDEAMTTAGVQSVRDQHSSNALNERQQRLSGVIQDFIRWRVQNPTMTADSAAHHKPLAALKTAIKQEPHDLVAVLVSNGLMIMSSDQLLHSGITASGDDWDVPTELQEFWMPAMQLMHEARILGELLIGMMSRVTGGGEAAAPHIRSQLLGWIRMMLDAYATDDCDVLSAMEWNRVLQLVISSPGLLSNKHVEGVLSKIPSMTDKRRRQVRRILKCSSGADNLDDSSASLNDTMPVRTIEDLQKLFKKDAARAQQSSAENSAWSECVDGDEWIGLPLGLAPGQTFESLSLIIDKDEWADRERRRNLSQKMTDSVESSDGEEADETLVVLSD